MLLKETFTNLTLKFSGHNHHDSQELLAFLLYGRDHEDLKCVKHKPYIDSKMKIGIQIRKLCSGLVFSLLLGCEKSDQCLASSVFFNVPRKDSNSLEH